jgi:predicted XRE-type DNA-binding protein
MIASGEAESSSTHLRLRAELMQAVREVIRDRGLRQREAAALFGVAQPRVSDLVRGKIALFSIDTLVEMLAAADVSVELVLRERRPAARRAASRGGRRARRSDADR